MCHCNWNQNHQEPEELQTKQPEPGCLDLLLLNRTHQTEPEPSHNNHCFSPETRLGPVQTQQNLRNSAH